MPRLPIRHNRRTYPLVIGRRRTGIRPNPRPTLPVRAHPSPHRRPMADLEKHTCEWKLE